jgi:putative membrane protein
MNWNWKLLLMRALISGITIVIVVLILPGIVAVNAENRPFLVNFAIVAIVFGLLNAFIKPVIQFITFPLLFVSFGLVVIVVNAIMLLLLGLLVPNILEVTNIWAALFGGALVGFIGVILENLLGVTPPIIDDYKEEDDFEEVIEETA